MTNTPDNDRHEKALEAAVHADGFTPNEADRRVVARAIATYLSEMDAVIVPRLATQRMRAVGQGYSRPDFVYSAMLSAAPHHFNQEGK